MKSSMHYRDSYVDIHHGNIKLHVPEFGRCVCVHRVADIEVILIGWHDTYGTARKKNTA